MSEQVVLISPDGELRRVEARPEILVPFYSASLIIPSGTVGSPSAGAGT
jgi:hypothetical protein